MNAVEIEDAVSRLVEHPFEPTKFPFQFLEAFGNKETTIARLKSGTSNQSDIPGAILQRSNIHLATCKLGETGQQLVALRASPANAKQKVKYIFATDGQTVEAENLNTGEGLACQYEDLVNHFGFFLALAGISTVKEIEDNPIDIRATSKLNKLYIELLDKNPDWDTKARRDDLNKFMARLIFCFFAEDTDIFNGSGLFTQTVSQMSDATNTHEVVGEIFRAMDVPTKHNGAPDNRHRVAAKVKPFADQFPYVNGGLFSGSKDVPRFSKMAKAYLFQAGSLNWKLINPDIFGSMIQAIADDEERGELGMHYTSVPNILKVLNPLFLDDLRDQLKLAGNNPRALLNLRKRMSRIRVFDPACGSGNFLVIAYKQMREIEAEINNRRGEGHLGSEIPLTNFRGIELRNFAAEVARLALIIAEFQCDVLYRGQKVALAEFLPLNAENWITCDDALKLDWVSVCPSTGSSVKFSASDLFHSPLDQAQIDFDNEGGETYICGNPPYIWANDQTSEQKADLIRLQSPFGTSHRSLDYVCGWIFCFLIYTKSVDAVAAFVTTNSITQGQQVDQLWPSILKSNVGLGFARRSFKWQNLAKSNAGVTCVILGLKAAPNGPRQLYYDETRVDCQNISPYLLPMENIWMRSQRHSLFGLPEMLKGNQPTCGGNLVFDFQFASALIATNAESKRFIRRLVGSDEISEGHERRCLWIEDEELSQANSISEISQQLAKVHSARSQSSKEATKKLAKVPHRFTEIRRRESRFIAVQCVSSENREYLTPVIYGPNTIITNRCFGIYQFELWMVALLCSRLHQVWCETTSGKLETRLNYSNTLTWNTFPLPVLSAQNKLDMAQSAEEILLARESYWPAKIADMYDPDKMDTEFPSIRAAHERNDTILERIYIGRRFRNDTERLEKLFEQYKKLSFDNATKSKKVAKRV